MDNDFILGKCCGCGIEGDKVRNIVALHYRAPEAGKGWGCFQCGLPPDGASVVLCDTCLDAQRYETIVVGYAGENNRMPYDDFMKTAQPFDHDMSKHPEATRTVSIDFVELDDDEDEPLTGWKCPHCGYIPEGMMDVVDIHEGQVEGSVCPACKVFVPTEDWIILSEDQMFDEWGFGGMDELDFEDESEDYDDFVDEDGFDRMGSDYADYDEPDDDEYPGADAAEMWGD
jgi:hypothetical protein